MDFDETSLCSDFVKFKSKFNEVSEGIITKRQLKMIHGPKTKQNFFLYVEKLHKDSKFRLN